jgi:parallel beta-helix repeat protein
MNRLAFACLAAAAVLAVCPCAFAETYVVAEGGDDANPGTEALPFATIQGSVDGLQPGDTVLVREGTYPGFEIYDLHGTEEAPITFKSYPGEHAVIDRALGAPEYFIVHIQGRCSYLVFEGLEVTNTDPLIDQLRELDITDPADLEVFLTYVDSFEVQYRDGVRINPPSTEPYHHHLKFVNLEIHHLIGLGFSGSGDNLEFIGNHVYDLGYPRSGYGWYVGRGDGNIFRGNVVHDCTYAFHLYNEGEGRPLANAVVEGNLVYDNGMTYYHMSSATVKVDGGGGLLVMGDGDNNTILNNVAYGNLNFGISVSSQNASVFNNTLFANEGDGLRVGDDTATLVRNNIAWRNDTEATIGTGSTADTNLFGEEPLFLDEGTNDLHLRAASPAVDSGAAIPAVLTDFDGIPRPQGAGYDIGAFEYNTLPPDFSEPGPEGGDEDEQELAEFPEDIGIEPADADAIQDPGGPDGAEGDDGPGDGKDGCGCSLAGRRP